MNAVNDIKLRRQYLPDGQNRFGKRILALADKTKSTGKTKGVITLDAKSTGNTKRVITLNAKSIGKMKRVVTLNAKSTGKTKRVFTLDAKSTGKMKRVITLNAKSIVLPARMGRGAPACAPLQPERNTNDMSKKDKIHSQIPARAASPYRQDKELCEVKTSFPPNLNNKTTSVASMDIHISQPHYLIKK
jgi:hypothetical protein